MKAVLLCSGGFDSVVLANYVRDWNNDLEIETLFFDYGQKSVEMERKCAIKVSEKIGAHFNEIKLPKFTWTKSEFYSDNGYSGLEKEYLEMRNLVFISYAMSLAESIGAKLIFMALLKHTEGYFDGTYKFVRAYNKLVKEKGIKLCAPFLKYYKYGLVNLINDYGISEDDFFTCDNPVSGCPCGKCPDCVDLKKIFELAQKNK